MKTSALKKIIIVSLVVGILFCLTYIEYDNFKLSRIIYPLIFVLAPFLLQYLFSNWYINVRHIIIAIVVYVGIISLSSLFSLFCGWSEDSFLYKNKNDKSLFIVCRRYDCYGTAEDCRLYKVKKLTKHIKWATKFKEKKVDTSKWIDIPFGSENFDP